ncbi:uncharacterized protein LOC135332050 isoform X2 [Halichondria panicea]|uniref:uncharacterized protein LOC135332050 isoform X2 n=1 Tax=Halichondria panicea TaxID=6063 RepID=UPI00312B4A16
MLSMFQLLSLLLLTVATTLASSQNESVTLGIKIAPIPLAVHPINTIFIICSCSISNCTTINWPIFSHRGEAISFWLNYTKITSGILRSEHRATAVFSWPKKTTFIGSFSCKFMNVTSVTLRFISMPEKDLVYAKASQILMSPFLILFLITYCIVLSLFFLLKQITNRGVVPSNCEENTLSKYPQHSKACKNTSCTTPETRQQEDHSLCSSTLSKADVQQFCYIDSPEEVMFDCKGGRYRNEDHDIELSVPEFAIPAGKRITVKIAVSLFSPLQLQQGLRPVSPIVKFCVMDDPYFKFGRPVKILLPHFLSTTSSSLNDLQFVKAVHGNRTFEECDGEATFKVESMYGTLLTHHFCHFCIASSVSSLSKANFRLVRVTPKNPSGTWKAQYCVTYFLQTCLKFLKHFYNVEQYEVTSLKRFVFSDPQATLQIHFERRFSEGWILTQDGGSSKLTENEVDCWRLDQDELKLMEEEELYPPRFVVKVNGHQATDQATALVRFTGAQGYLETELSLEPLSYHHTTHLPTSVSLPNVPSSKQPQVTPTSQQERPPIPKPRRSPPPKLDSSPEYKTMLSCTPHLITAVTQDPQTIYDEMIAAFKSVHIREFIRHPIHTNRAKATRLVDFMTDQVKTSPSDFDKFMAILKSLSWTERIVGILITALAQNRSANVNM